MRDQKILAITFLAAICVLGIMALAFGAAPEFPFQNIAQLDGTPDWNLVDRQAGEVCGMLVQRSQFAHPAKDDVWLVFTGSNNKVHAGHFPNVTSRPDVLYYGYITDASGKITITRSEPFDPAKHTGICPGLE